MPSHKARFLALMLLVALGLAVRAEHPLATLQQVLPTHGPLTQVTEWQGRAVALSADPNGSILRRQAQGDWEEIATGLPYIAELVQNGTLSLALTRDGTLHRSQAWPQWEEVPPFDEKITGLRALNGEFWVWTGPVGIVNNVRPGLYRSPDGTTWTEVTTGLGFPQPPIRRINDLQWANSRYVLTGNAYQTFQGVSRHHGGLWTSSDGTHWTRHADVDNEFTSAAYGNGRWVAVTTNENYAISTDGVTWTPQQHNFVSHHISNSQDTYPVYSPLNNIVWNGLNFTAIAVDRGSPLLVVSDNGIAWNTVNPIPERPQMRLSVAEGRTWSLAGRPWLDILPLDSWNGTVSAWSSTDWRWGMIRELPLEPTHWKLLLSSPERAVVLGAGRFGWTDDGVQWHFGDLPGIDTEPMAGVWAEDRKEFFVVSAIERGEYGSQLRLWRSSDGITWGTRILGASYAPMGMARGAGVYVMPLANGEILYSPDGMSWHQTAVDWDEVSPPYVDFRVTHPHSIVYADGQFLTIDPKGRLASSVDGKSWVRGHNFNPLNIEVPSNFLLCRGAGLWLVSSRNGNWASEDDRVWIPQESDLQPQEMIFAQGEFFSAESSKIRSSKDGLLWFTHDEVSYGNGLSRISLLFFKNRLLVAGSHGRLYHTSPWRDFFTEWCNYHFTPADRANPLISGDEADPDHDGVPNLLEYALDLNPKETFSPILSGYYFNGGYELENDSYAMMQTLSFPSWKNTAGVSAWVEYSTDLRTWKRLGLRSHLSSPINLDNYLNFEIRNDSAVGAMRLRASKPSP